MQTEEFEHVFVLSLLFCHLFCCLIPLETRNVINNVEIIFIKVLQQGGLNIMWH